MLLNLSELIRAFSSLSYICDVITRVYMCACSMPFTSTASLVGWRLGKSALWTTVNGSSRSKLISYILVFIPVSSLEHKICVPHQYKPVMILHF